MIRLFSGLDANGKTILVRRQRTSRKCREYTGWVVRQIEVDEHATAFVRCIDRKETPATVGLQTVGTVSKRHEERVRIGVTGNIHSVRLAVNTKHNGAG